MHFSDTQWENIKGCVEFISTWESSLTLLQATDSPSSSFVLSLVDRLLREARVATEGPLGEAREDLRRDLEDRWLEENAEAV